MLLTGVSAISAISAIVLGLVTQATADSSDYCTFYTEDRCEVRSGHVSYQVTNPSIFQNGGPYFQCAAGHSLNLISYPRGDSTGSHPDNCHQWSSDDASMICHHLDDYGFTPGDGGYYRLSEKGPCPVFSAKKQPRDDQLATNASEKLEKRGAFVTFYDDPDCSEQSGHVHYDVKNQGCFENGGAYFQVLESDNDWHMTQWEGIDGKSCQGKKIHCEDGSNLLGQPDNYNLCKHLDDYGFRTGRGSYRIERHGCP